MTIELIMVSVFYEGEYYYEWGWVIKDSDLDGILELIDDEVVGRYYSATASEDRPSDNGIWEQEP